MKKVITIIIFAGLFYSSIFAQETEEKKEEVDLSGKFALLFQLGNNFNLSNFEGTTFSAKYQFDHKSAVRFSVSTGINANYSEEVQIYDGDVIVKEVGDSDVLNIGFNATYLRYLRSFDDIKFYLGGGIDLGVRETKVDSKHEITGDSFYSTNILNSYGVQIVIGVEWFVKNNISFLAEYASSYAYRVEDYSQPYGDYTRIKHTRIERWEFANHGAKIGLSLYF